MRTHLSSNIGPEAQAAYQKFLDANTLEDRIKLLQEFISLVPKHKATEKLVALHKHRLAKLKQELEEDRERRKEQIGGIKSAFSFKKEEQAQIILASAYQTPGVGKSTLLTGLTGAGNEGIFTPEPVIGTYIWKKVRFQLIDMPAIMKDASQGVGNGSKILPMLRSTDIIALCIDVSRDPREQWDLLMHELTEAHVRLNESAPPIDIERTGSGRVQVRLISPEAKDSPVTPEEIVEILSSNGLKNAIVRIRGKITAEDVEDALNPRLSYRKAVVIATKGDHENSRANFERLKELAGDKFPLVPTAVINGVPRNFQDFGGLVLNMLNRIRIYTRNRAGVAQKPLVLDKGATVGEVAKKIHKTLYETFKFAYVFREGAKIPKIKAGLNFVLEDADVVEIFAKG